VHLDQPERGQVSQGLAHRRLTRAQLASDARLDDPLARAQLTLDDPAQQPVLDLGRKDAPREGHELLVRHR